MNRYTQGCFVWDDVQPPVVAELVLYAVHRNHAVGWLLDVFVSPCHCRMQDDLTLMLLPRSTAVWPSLVGFAFYWDADGWRPQRSLRPSNLRIVHRLLLYVERKGVSFTHNSWWFQRLTVCQMVVTHLSDRLFYFFGDKV